MRRCLPVLFAMLSLATVAPSLQATSFLHKKLEEWRRDLAKSPKASARRSAAFAIGRIGPLASFAMDELARTLRNDPDESVREMAASAIGDIVLAIKTYRPAREWSVAGKALQEALARDDSPRVRRSAAYALGAFGEQATGSVATLKEALRDKHAIVRQNAAWALGRVGGDDSAIADLCARLDDDSHLVRRDAAGALGQLATRLGGEKLREAAAPLLKLARNERDDVVRKTALGALATLADKSHRDQAPNLYPLLEHKDVETARAAAYALGNMGGEPARRALTILRSALADPDPNVQALTAAVLANAEGDAASAADDLARTLTLSRRADVRRNCAIALTRISDAVVKGMVDGARIDDISRSAIPALIEALKPLDDPAADPAATRAHEEVRTYVAEAISAIRYPANEKALSTIRDILKKDTNQNVRQRSIWALFQCRDIDKFGLTPVLTGVLDEKGDETLLVRYDAARLLAWALRERAPDRTCDVLLHMINNRELRVFHGSGAAIEGIGNEGTGGTSRATANQGGDARFMAAEAMACLGDKARKNKEIMAALRKAAEDDDPTLKKHAKEALKDLAEKD
jgi:HEAT repeat protein